MAARIIYLTVRLDINSPRANEITDEEVDEIISEVDYEFRNYGDYEIDTEICRKNDEGGFWILSRRTGHRPVPGHAVKWMAE